MNYRLYLPAIAMLATLTGCDQLQSSRSTDTGSADTTSDTATAAAGNGPVVATVNGTEITQGVLDVYAKQRKQQAARNDDPNAVLNELISLELMRQEGVNKGLDKKPLVINAIAQQQRTVLAGAAITDFMTNNAASDEEIKTFYDENMGKPGNEYKARHILLENQEDATAVIKQLDEGADFSELAKEKSTGPSGASGGELGWFGAGQMVKPFSDATAALEKDAYTKEPVQTQFGWHVIILDDTRESTPPPFDDVKDRLKMMLANQKLQQHVQSLKDSADIQIQE